MMDIVDPKRLLKVATDNLAASIEQEKGIATSKRNLRDNENCIYQYMVNHLYFDSDFKHLGLTLEDKHRIADLVIDALNALGLRLVTIEQYKKVRGQDDE